MKVLVIGGGLAGLYAATLLHETGTDYRLIEARERLGGRILTVDRAGTLGGDFDLGPSWYWPEVQPRMAAMVEKLGLSVFPQQGEGDVMFERMLREKPRRFRSEEPPKGSMRIAGGTGTLVRALAERIPAEQVRLGTRVVRADLDLSGVTLTPTGGESPMRADRVIAALPPRLLEATVVFEPDLPEEVRARWRETATWMAPHAKFFALYDRPFWREAGLSGAAQSMAGPLVEIHDATTASGKAALFGFVGPGAAQRNELGEAALGTACLAQLTRLFGPEAGRPLATLFKDWAADDLTATDADRSGGGHPHASDLPWVSGPWQGRLSLAGSETSGFDPGYMEGALDAAERAVREVLERNRG